MKNKKIPYLRNGLLLILLISLFAIGGYSSFYNDQLSDQSSSLTPTSIPNPNQNLDQYNNQSLEPSIDVLESPVLENLIVENPVVEDLIIERTLSFQDHLAIQAELRLQSDVTYDGSYRKIAYPMGDVPEGIGVCTDVVIRTFRGLGIDLQQRVHEDMKRNFRSYPKKWKLSKPDTNIDHRRVPNLMTYFKRAGAELKITDDPLDYYAGDVVAWELRDGKGKNMLHIGIVSNYVSEITSNPLIIHNIGAGPELEDMLFRYKIIGHYKYGKDGEYDEHNKISTKPERVSLGD